MPSRRLYFALPAALVASAGFAWLASGSAFDGGFDGAPRLAQAAPPAAQPPAAGGGADKRGERMRDFSPKAMCEEHIARRIGNRAYLKERLDLNPDQITPCAAFQRPPAPPTPKQ